MCYGNGGINVQNKVRLYNSNLSSSINATNIAANDFGVGLFSRSFLGRQKGKLTWEVKQQGSAFNGSPIVSTLYSGQQTNLTDFGINGAELKAVVTKAGLQSKVRMRTKYNPVTAITGQMYGPWRYTQGYLSGGMIHNAVPLKATILPIELLSFSGKNKGTTNLLEWKTATEINNDYFTIERSQDGEHFESIGIADGAGNSTTEQNYFFEDSHISYLTSHIYYRLKQTDFNGDYTYSNIISLTNQQLITHNLSLITLYPNPSNGKFTLQMDDLNGMIEESNHLTIIEIYNTLGEKVCHLESSSQALNQIDLSSQPNDLYFINIKTEKELITQKVIIQK